MPISDELIEKDKTALYYLIAVTPPLRHYKDIINPKTRRIFIGNEKTGKVNNYRISRALKELQEELKIVARKTKSDIEYYPIKGFLDQIIEKTKKNFGGMRDSLISKIKKTPFVEEVSAQISQAYAPTSIDVYLTYCTLNRSRQTQRRPTGWAIEEYIEDEMICAKKTSDKGNVSLELILENSEKRDWVKLKGTFRRKAKEVMRIPKNHIAYVRRVFSDLLIPIANRTQILDFHARKLVYGERGNEEKIYAKIENIDLIKNEQDKNKKQEFIVYTQKRINYHLDEYIRLLEKLKRSS